MHVRNTGPQSKPNFLRLLLNRYPRESGKGLACENSRFSSRDERGEKSVFACEEGVMAYWQ